MMSIVRVRKEEKYSVISNAVLNDKNLSWEARGVMAYLLSKPDGWECRNYDLVNQGPASDFVIRRVIKELQEAGYIHRYRKSDGRGTIEWVTEIYETPELNTALRNGSFSNLESFEMESFDLEKPQDIVSTDLSKYGSTENKDFNAQKPKNSRTKNSQALNDLADSIASVCGNLDIDMIAPKTRDALKVWTVTLHKKGATPSVVMDGFGPWWYDNTWQGKKGQPPTLQQLGDHWGQFEAANTNGASSYTPNLTPEQIEMLRQFQLDTSPIK